MAALAWSHAFADMIASVPKCSRRKASAGTTATRHGVMVTNTPGVLNETTADFAFTLLLAAARRVPEGDRLVRGGGWTGWEIDQLLGQDANGATLGVVGFGRIGRAVARRGRGFGMRVVYTKRHRLSPAEERTLGVTFASLDDLLAQSDFVSVHAAHTPQTHHLIGERELRRMKPQACLINTSRGPLVDEAALIRALREGWISGAGLDVYEQEPRVSPGLLELPNAVLTPHIGSAERVTREAIAGVVVDNILAFARGDRPPNVVNPEVWER